MAKVSQREPAGVSQHVGMGLKAELGLDASTLHHASKAASRERRVPLGREHERRLRLLQRCNLRRPRNSSPRMGWLLGTPFLALRTCRTAWTKST